MLPLNFRNRNYVVETSIFLYWSFANWTVALGVFLLLAPPWFFGPSWSYFNDALDNGAWMGTACVIVGLLQIVVLARKPRRYTQLSLLFFCSGFIYWLVGLILLRAGLIGHMGLMEAPFMFYVGAHKFAHSASLWVRRRQ